MELIIHDRDDISFVALEGRLDADGVEEMEEPFAAATAERGLPTVVDMSGITFMSSLGIGFLFSNSKKLKKAGCKLVLLNPKGMVEAVLKTSKMDKVMPLMYDVAEAIEAVGGDPTVGAPAAQAEATPAPAATGAEEELGFAEEELSFAEPPPAAAPALAAAEAGAGCGAGRKAGQHPQADDHERDVGADPLVC